MHSHIAAITIGVQDTNRAKQFYEGLGWAVNKEQPGVFVAFRAADGSSTLALYPLAAQAQDGGVPADRSGFHGVTFNYFVRSEARVDEILADAARAGGTITKPGQRSEWGGYTGHFSDPDGYLWKVVAADNGERFSE